MGLTTATNKPGRSLDWRPITSIRLWLLWRRTGVSVSAGHCRDRPTPLDDSIRASCLNRLHGNRLAVAVGINRSFLTLPASKRVLSLLFRLLLLLLLVLTAMLKETTLHSVLHRLTPHTNFSLSLSLSLSLSVFLKVL